MRKSSLYRPLWRGRESGPTPCWRCRWRNASGLSGALSGAMAAVATILQVELVIGSSAAPAITHAISKFLVSSRPIGDRGRPRTRLSVIDLKELFAAIFGLSVEQTEHVGYINWLSSYQLLFRALAMTSPVRVREMQSFLVGMSASQPSPSA